MTVPAPQQRRLHAYPDRAALIADLAAQFAAAAKRCIAARGAFHCVLAGGETPRLLYRRMRTIETDWRRWHIYFGDERCLPPGDSARNDAMAQQSWLDHVAIPPAQIHGIRAELGPDAAAVDYARTLRGVGVFDLVLLGLGEDGHTASLFPYMLDALAESGPVIAVHAAPKPPPQRVSLGARRLARAERVWFLVCGEGKRAALTRWLAGAALPAGAIAPPGGVDIFTDLAPA